MGPDRIDAAVPAPGPAATQAPAHASPSGGGFSFHELLSDLNPLQYIPVVGTIYRAVTGDEGNSTLREIASLGTSFALGGPLGLGITVAEKLLGIDPEKIGRQLLGHLLHPHATVTVSEAGGTTATTTAAADTAPGAARGWTAHELGAYGIHRAADGTLVGANGSSGADLLNGRELGRLRGSTA